MEGCHIIPDPSDPSKEIVTLCVPAGTVPCASTLAAHLVEMDISQKRCQLLIELRNAPLAILQAAAVSLNPQ